MVHFFDADIFGLKKYMTPARDPKQVFSTNLDNHGREIRKEESWRRNHGAGFLGGIWEAFGKMR